jgi:hypothetical protein
MKYWLVSGATAHAVEQSTGLRSIDTPIGVLVEQPRPFDLEAAMSRLDRALHPRSCYCTVVHMPPCPHVYACS